MKSEKRKIVVVCGKYRHTIKVGGGEKKILLFKLGDPKTGWIPSRKHFEMLRDMVVTAFKSKDPTYCLFFHYAVTVQEIHL